MEIIVYFGKMALEMDKTRQSHLEYIQNKIFKNQDKHLLWKEMWINGILFLFSLNMGKLQLGAMRMVPPNDLRDEGNEGDDHWSEVTE